MVMKNKKLVATVDFQLKGSRLVFSHFTLGKAIQNFYMQFNAIYKQYTMPEEETLEVLKIYVLGCSFIKFL